MPIRVLLADDHRLFRHGVRALLSMDADFVVVGEVGDGQELLDCVADLRPDVVCLEVDMARVKGAEATRRLRLLMPDVKVVGLSDRADWPAVRDLMKAGARGFVSKSASPDELGKAIRNVVRLERRHLCPQSTDAVMEAVLGDDAELPAASPLTVRERQVLACIAQGMTSPEIARRLDLRLTTVRGYRSNIMRSLDLHNGPDLTRYAIHHGIVGGADDAHPC